MTRLKKGGEEAMSRKTTVASLIALFCLTISVFAAPGDETNVKGFIKTRNGDILVIQTASGDVPVALTDETKTKDNRGLLGVREQEMADTVLIPGLKVNIDGELGLGNRVTATTITVDGDDLESSQMIQAGLHPTAQQVAANVQRLGTHQQAIETNQQQIEANIKQTEAHEQRFANLDDFDVKGQTTAKFATGSSTISDADKLQLKQLAEQTKQVPGYLIEVIGFADSTGNAAMNEHETQRAARKSGCRLPHSAVWCAGTSHRGTWRDGRVWINRNKRNKYRASCKPPGRS
jgi:OmpA-OmpF porin, OOP family